jgi:hypothetical protein
LKISIIKTNNFKPWTQHYARIIAVNKSKGERLICLDIDHIATRKLIEFVLNSDYDVMKFQRRFGILDESGDLKTDRKTIIEYGVDADRINRRGCRIPPPGNVFAITKKLFLYLESQSGRFWHILKRMARAGKINFCKTNERPLVYMFPVGRYCGSMDADPLNLFHGLSRNTEGYQDAERQCGAR